MMNQMRSWLATWGCALPSRRATRVVDHGAGLGGAPLAADGASAPRAGGGPRWRCSRRRSRSSTRRRGHDASRGGGQCVGPPGAVEGGGHDRRVGVARRRAWSGARSGIAARSAGSWVSRRRRIQSGEVARDQGISRAGNERLQAISIQLAWNWVRWQPTSALTHWYRERFAGGGKRLRRIGIVAVARKLVIALWRYATTGVVPAGAILKGA